MIKLCGNLSTQEKSNCMRTGKKKKKEEHSECCIITLTAHDNGSYIIKAFEVGFDIKALTQFFLITLSYRTEYMIRSFVFPTHWLHIHLKLIDYYALKVCTSLMIGKYIAYF